MGIATATAGDFDDGKQTPPHPAQPADICIVLPPGTAVLIIYSAGVERTLPLLTRSCMSSGEPEFTVIPPLIITTASRL
jgi:hypothetical protein